MTSNEITILILGISIVGFIVGIKLGKINIKEFLNKFKKK